jgi:replication factor A1
MTGGESVYEKIKERVSKKEFEEKVSEILEHFGELISKETAEALAAYHYGYTPAETPGRAKKKRGKVLVEGIVDRVFQVRHFVRKDRKGRVGRLLVRNDESVTVKLWDDAAGLIETGEIVEGAWIRLRGYVREGEINVNDPQDVDVRIVFTPTDGIKPGTRVNLRGRVSGLGKPEGRKELHVSDETGRVKVVLLGRNEEAYWDADIGSEIKIFNAKVTIEEEGKIEIYADKKSRVKLGE